MQAHDPSSSSPVQFELIGNSLTKKAAFASETGFTIDPSSGDYTSQDFFIPQKDWGAPDGVYQEASPPPGIDVE